MKKVLLILLAVSLSGCVALNSSFNPAISYNEKQEAAFQPTRAEYTTFNNGASSVLSFGVWAGDLGVTAANDQYQVLIYEKFEQNCGLHKDDLKEIRIVKHEPNFWYEVWVFNDDQSQRSDKTSGMSVVMKYAPDTNITEVNLIGNCVNRKNQETLSSRK